MCDFIQGLRAFRQPIPVELCVRAVVIWITEVKLGYIELGYVTLG